MILDSVEKGEKSLLALKLDMNKAYDRVNCAFLLWVLQVMGSSSMRVSLIMECVGSVSFSVFINNQPTEFFTPSCGLHQRDMLSPFLFILVAQDLSSSLSSLASNQISRGISICSRAHLFHTFCLLMIVFFLEFNVEHIWDFKWVLDGYCFQSGQYINFQ